MNKSVVAVSIIMLLAGLAGGYWLATKTGAEQMMAVVKHDEHKPLFYRHPMNPSITSPTPAKDEMGMDYVPVYAGGGGGDEPAGTVRIDPVTVQNIGVRTTPVNKKVLSRDVRAVGRVDYDEEHLASLHPKVEGWVEELRIDKTGEAVKKDTILLGIYSPQLVSSQEEYLLALRNRDALEQSPFEDIRRGAFDLVRSSRERLELLDVPEHQIRELEQTGRIKKTLHIHSPFDGVVLKVGAREGEFVTPKTELYRIADLTKIWVYVDVFEDELPWVRRGDEAVMNVAGVPGRIFRGKITYIYPYLESKTRTVKVRMEFDNHKGLLKPAMFADVTISASRQIDAIVVPSEAVVRSGSRNQVFVVRGPGKFEPREVELGVTSEGMTQILKGVDSGEQVVSSAQFLIDSESKLREATAKMMAAGRSRDAKSGQKMDMPNMNMDDMDMKSMQMGNPREAGESSRATQHDKAADPGRRQ